jgi:hypothetical protein
MMTAVNGVLKWRRCSGGQMLLWWAPTSQRMRRGGDLRAKTLRGEKGTRGSGCHREQGRQRRYSRLCWGKVVPGAWRRSNRVRGWFTEALMQTSGRGERNLRRAPAVLTEVEREEDGGLDWLMTKRDMEGVRYGQAQCGAQGLLARTTEGAWGLAWWQWPSDSGERHEQSGDLREALMAGGHRREKETKGWLQVGHGVGARILWVSRPTKRSGVVSGPMNNVISYLKWFFKLAQICNGPNDAFPNSIF